MDETTRGPYEILKLPGERVLMYHSVSSQVTDENLVCTSPRLFEGQMRLLSRLGLRGVSMETLQRSAGERNSGRFVGITFDDGYTDFLHTAVPILERYGFTATVFALSGAATENIWDHNTSNIRLRLMDPDQLREARKRGMEVGSHGISHHRLPTLQRSDVKREIFDSRDAIEEILGEAVPGFCYPYGELTFDAIEAVQEAEYDYACAVDPGPHAGNFAIPRIPVNDLDSLPRFLAKLGVYWRYRRLKGTVKGALRGDLHRRTRLL